MRIGSWTQVIVAPVSINAIPDADGGGLTSGGEGTRYDGRHRHFHRQERPNARQGGGVGAATGCQ